MRFKLKSPCFILAALVLLLLPAAAQAAEVDVFAEGAYSYNRTSPATTGKLVVYLYANINTDPLCSYGVKLSFDASKLGSPLAEKNTGIWYMGDASPGNTYMDPVATIPDPPVGSGNIVFVGGKLKTTAPSEGVTGQRVFLGKVSFTRLDNAAVGSDPAVYFGIGLALGKTGDYDNFVTVGGVKKDGATAFTYEIREAGDVVGTTRAINAGDAQRVMQIYNGTYPFTVFADCTLNGSINAGDAQCIMQKYSGTYY